MICTSNDAVRMFLTVGKDSPAPLPTYSMFEYALDTLASVGYTHHTTDVAGDLHYDKAELLREHFPNESRKQELEATIRAAQEELENL